MALAAGRRAVVLVVLGVLLDERRARAQGAALPQPAVQRLKPLGGVADEQHQRHVTDGREDVHPDLRLVGHVRGGVDLVLLHPPFEQGANRRLGTCDLEFVGVRQQLRP